MEYNNDAREFPKIVYLIGLGFASFWLLLIWNRYSSIIGCSQAPDWIYDDIFHSIAIVLYISAHVSLVWYLSLLDQPRLNSQPKHGRVELILRKIKLFIVFRFTIVTVWLLLFFFTNAESTDVPISIISIHFVLQILFAIMTFAAIKTDNETLAREEQMKLNKMYYFFLFLELIVGSFWLTVNVIDVHKCHADTFHSYLKN